MVYRPSMIGIDSIMWVDFEAWPYVNLCCNGLNPCIMALKAFDNGLHQACLRHLGWGVSNSSPYRLGPREYTPP